MNVSFLSPSLQSYFTNLYVILIPYSLLKAWKSNLVQTQQLKHWFWKQPVSKQIYSPKAILILLHFITVLIYIEMFAFATLHCFNSVETPFNQYFQATFPSLWTVSFVGHMMKSKLESARNFSYTYFILRQVSQTRAFHAAVAYQHRLRHSSSVISPLRRFSQSCKTFFIFHSPKN